MKHSTQREVLSADKVDTVAIQAMTTFHTKIVEEVRKAVEGNEIVVVGMAQNPVVKAARETLKGKKLAFKYLEYGSYLSMWKERLAIKLWSGWPTYPQVFINGKLIGGNKELQEWIKAGKLKH
jgi:monothiol glutaredoxin